MLFIRENITRHPADIQLDYQGAHIGLDKCPAIHRLKLKFNPSAKEK
jgi:hypothetical protein